MDDRRHCSCYWAFLPVALALVGLLVDRALPASGTANAVLTGVGIPTVVVVLMVVAALAREDRSPVD